MLIARDIFVLGKRFSNNGIVFNAACGGIGLVVSECHSIVSGQLLLRFVTCYASYGRGKEKNIISYNLVDTRERRVFTSGVMS